MTVKGMPTFEVFQASKRETPAGLCYCDSVVIEYGLDAQTSYWLHIGSLRWGSNNLEELERRLYQNLAEMAQRLEAVSGGSIPLNAYPEECPL